MSKRFWAAAGLVLLVAAGSGLVACKDGDTVVYNIIEQLLFPTRADAIATPVSDSWHDPTSSSINPARRDWLPESDFRVFRARDGAGIVAFLEHDEFLYLAYYGPSGAVGQPVRIRGDLRTRRSFPSANPIKTMIVVWTPQGDAAIAFVGEQESYPDVSGDQRNDRVYYTTFRRSLAAVSHAASGEEYGFETDAIPVDAHTVSTDDDDVLSLFVATSLVDGSAAFPRTNQISELAPDLSSGDAGDAAADHGGHFIFFGWVDWDGDRADGRFVNLDSAGSDYLKLGSPQAVSTTPALRFNAGTPLLSDKLTGRVWTSGRDILLEWKQSTGSGAWQSRFSLVRVNAARAGLDVGIDVGRGDATPGTTSSLELESAGCFVGDGYRALNGQAATWLFFTQDDFVDGSSVTNPDKDLVIARVDDAGQVSIAELDHEGATATSTDNHVILEACLVGRGASRALLLYRQTLAATTSTASTTGSLFARAVYLDGSTGGSVWPNVVSDEVRINQTVSVTSTGPPDVTEVWTAAVAPYCQPQYDNDAFYVAFAQQVEGLPDKSALRYARLVMNVPADVTASKVALVATESTIEGQLDTDWEATLHNVALAEAGTADGAVVFYSANGNNKADDAPANDFVEHRVYAWAHRLPDATSTPALPSTEVSSLSPLSSLAAGFPSDWRPVRDWELHVTPRVAASRDYALDTDTAAAELAHLLLRERSGDTSDPYILRGRALDLRNGVSTVGAERFFPRPDEEPEMVSSGRHARTDADADMWNNHAVLFSGNALVATFPENATGDGDGVGQTWGQLFVNTFDPGARSWSDAALLSNESYEELYTDGQRQWVALVAGARNGCPDALGAWAFWTKSPAAATDEHASLATYVQGRRFTGVALPAR